MVILSLTFLGSAGMLLHTNLQYREGTMVYTEAEELVQLPKQELPPVAGQEGEEPEILEGDPHSAADPYAEALQKMDFAALQAVNADVLGWILIPETRISYPLVQGEDNEYYLDHTWKRSSSSVGAVFLEYRNSRDLCDFHTIVYGHRMRDGSMFASLKYYDRQAYWEDHPRIYLLDEQGTHAYDIFSAYEADVTGDAYQLAFSTAEERQVFLDHCIERSVLETGIVPAIEDQILTLSTCTGRGHDTRWVVQAVRSRG